MPLTNALIALATLASPTTPASDAASRAAIDAYIQQCETLWAQGAVTDNSAQVAPFIAADYHGVSGRGKVHDRAGLLTPYQAEGKAAGLYYAKVRYATPAVAIVQGEEWWEEKTGVRHHLIWTDTWLFRDGKWQIAASQDSQIPIDQPLQN